MFVNTVLFVLLAILWSKSRESREEQERLSKLAKDLERRLDWNEKELATLQQRVAERSVFPADHEATPPVQEQAKAQATLQKLTAANAPAQTPPPPPIPAEVKAPASTLHPPPQSSAASVPKPKPVAPAPVAAPQPAFNFEQFLGVKLFAWLGAFIGFLAVAFALKYSFDQGWVSPAVRVAGGLIAGIALLIGGLKLNRDRYAVTVQSLCGAGIVVLYADLFTAHAFYKLIESSTATFLLMSLVTTVAFFLAVRLNAQPVAILGLLGGFLTPVLISTGQDNPLGLFGYITLLDVGLLAVALRQRWLHLTLLAGVATVVMQLAWAGKFFAVEKIGVAMTVFLFFSALFFAFFSIVHRVVAQAADEAEKWSSYAAGLMPSIGLLFAWFIFAHPYRELGERPGLMFSFIFLLDLALLGMAWTRHKLRPVQLLGGGAAFLLLMVWTGSFLTNALLNWSLGFTLLFAVLHAVFPVVQQRLQPNLSRVWWMHLFPPVALLLVLIPLFKLEAPSFLVWPVVMLIDVVAIGVAVLTGSLLAVFAVFALTVLATGVWMFHLPPQVPEVSLVLLVIGFFTLFFVVAAVFAVRKFFSKLVANPAAPASGGTPMTSSLSPEMVTQLFSFAAAMPFLLLTMTVARLPLANPSQPFGLAAVLVVLLLVGVLRYFEINLLAGVALGSVLVMEYAWHLNHFAPDHAGVALAWYLAFPAMFFIYPFLFRFKSNVLGEVKFLCPFCQQRLSANADTAFATLACPSCQSNIQVPGSVTKMVPWVAGALALPLHFHLIYDVIKRAWPNDFLGLVPALLAVPCLVSVVWLVRRVPVTIAARNSLLALFGGVALFFITLIFPIQFDKQWLTVAWALEGVALLWLFHRVPHPGLPLVGVVLLGVAFVRLALNGEVLSYHPRSNTPIFNWYLYTYGIVTICLFAAARLLAPPREKVRGMNVLPLLYSLGTVLAFILVNIEIADYFSEGTRTTFELFGGNLSREKQLGRDMTYSLAWAAFAFVVLVIGFKRRVVGARRAGMVLLSVTLLKLFLHDLWRLGDLYRIGALLGLAIVPILVSMIYQKFLATEAERKTPAPPSIDPNQPPANP